MKRKTWGQWPTLGRTTKSSTELKFLNSLPSSMGSHGSLSPHAIKTGHWKEEGEILFHNRLASHETDLDIRFIKSSYLVTYLHLRQKFLRKRPPRVTNEFQKYICSPRLKPRLKDLLNQLISHLGRIMITLEADNRLWSGLAKARWEGAPLVFPRMYLTKNAPNWLRCSNRTEEELPNRSVPANWQTKLSAFNNLQKLQLFKLPADGDSKQVHIFCYMKLNKLYFLQCIYRSLAHLW